MTTAGDNYVWRGPLTGSWNTASNWTDTTTGANPSTVAPGSNDSATFNSLTGLFQVISGTGNSAYLTFSGDNIVLGQLTTGALSNTGQLEIEAGGSLSAATATTTWTTGTAFNASAGITVTGGGFDVSGTLTVNGASNGLTAASGAIVKAGSLTLSSGTIGVDATSSIEVGHAGGTTVGALTVDAGAVLTVTGGSINGKVIDHGLINITSAAGLVLQSLSGDGQVEVGDKTNLSVSGGIAAGSLGLTLGKGDSLLLGQASAGNTVGLGGGDVLTLSGQTNYSYGFPVTTFDMEAAVTGFDGTDAIVINGPVTTATYKAGSSAGTGTLTLANGATTLATLTLDGNYTGDTFLTVPTNASAPYGGTQTEIVLAAPGSTSPSAGTTTGDQFVWRGSVAGDWNTASNWQDTTTGANPSTVAPGSKDSVTFNSPTNLFQVINGTGNSASLTFNGDNVVLGQLTTGALSNTGQLQIEAGGSLSASTATTTTGTAFNPSAGIAVTGGGFDVGGALTVNGSSNGLTAVSGAIVKAGSLTLLSGTVAVDATSSIEVGHAGGAAAGALTVDAGAVLTAKGGSINGKVIDHGLINVTSGTWGLQSLSGDGQVVVGDKTNLSIFDDIAAGSLGLTLGKGAGLFVGQVGAGVTISLGAGDVLTLDGQTTYSSGTPVTTFDMEGVVSGFDTTDALLIDAAVTTATYKGGSSTGTGTLTLANGATTLATLTLQGDYAGDTFLAVPVNSLVPGVGSGETEIVLAAPGSTSASAGTTTGDQFVWHGFVGGDWNTASNWQDASTGASPSTVAPGSKDSVTFNSPTNLSQVISGTGNSAYLTFNGNNAVVGHLTTGALSNTGQLQIEAGASLSASTATTSSLFPSSGFDTYSGIAVAGGRFNVSGTLTVNGVVNGLAAVDAARITAGSLTLSSGIISVDGTSSIEVGHAGGTTVGALTVDTGAVLTTTGGSINGKVIDHGLINVTSGGGLTLQTLSGDGLVKVGDNAHLSVFNASGALGFTLSKGDSLTLGQVGAGATITLGGSDGLTLNGQTTYSFGTPVTTFDMEGVVSGFDATDAIVIDTAVTAATYKAGSSAGTGTLTLANGTTTVSTIALNGDYTGDTFLTVPVNSTSPSGGSATQISLIEAGVKAQGNTIQIATKAGVTVSLNQIIADLGYGQSSTIGTVDISGPGTVSVGGNLVTINTLDIGSGSTLQLASGAINSGSITIESGGTLVGAGVIRDNINDNGDITATGGTLNLMGAISGTGTLTIGNHATLGLIQGVPSGVAIDFQPQGSGETLSLATPLGVDGTISNFTLGDTITLPGSYRSVTRSFSGDTMIVTGDGKTIADLELAPGYNDANTSVSDANGVVTIQTSRKPGPIVLAVSAAGPGVTAGSGDLGAGSVATLTLAMSTVVNVDTTGGVPTLTLNDGATATYTGGSGTKSLVFTYKVAAGQNSSALNIIGSSLNGATMSDASGNAADLTGADNNLTGVLRIDTTPPAVTDTITSTDTISGTGDPNAIVHFTIDGKAITGTAFADGTGAWTYTPVGLADGSHTILASETDAAGNTGTASLAFTFETTVAQPTVTLTGFGPGGAPLVSGTAEAGAIVTLHDGTTVIGTATADAQTGTFSIAGAGLSAGEHILTATATYGGQTSAASTPLTVEVGSAATIAGELDALAAKPGLSAIVLTDTHVLTVDSVAAMKHLIDSDGSALAAIQGGYSFAIVAPGSNGDTTLNYDATGVLVSTVSSSSNGSTTRVETVHPDGSRIVDLSHIVGQNYVSEEDKYNTAGVITSALRTYADGAVASDYEMAQDGSISVKTYDASGHLTYDGETHTNGTRDVFKYNPAGQSYSTEQDHFNAAGVITSALRTYADGSVASDYEMAPDGSISVKTYDANGHLIYDAETHTDGTRDVFKYNPTGQNSISEHDVYGSKGTQSLVDLTTTNGSHQTFIYASNQTLNSNTDVSDVFTNASAGSTTFSFNPAFGQDVISGFHAGTGSNHDVIHINNTALTQYSDLAALMKPSGAAGADTLITLDPNDTILLKQVALSSLNAKDFSFNHTA